MVKRIQLRKETCRYKCKESYVHRYSERTLFIAATATLAKNRKSQWDVMMAVEVAYYEVICHVVLYRVFMKIKRFNDFIFIVTLAKTGKESYFSWLCIIFSRQIDGTNNLRYFSLYHILKILMRRVQLKIINMFYIFKAVATEINKSTQFLSLVFINRYTEVIADMPRGNARGVFVG